MNKALITFVFIPLVYGAGKESGGGGAAGGTGPTTPPPVLCGLLPDSVPRCLGNIQLLPSEVASKCPASKTPTQCSKFSCVASHANWTDAQGWLDTKKVDEYFTRWVATRPQWARAVDRVRGECLSGRLPPQGIYLDCVPYDVFYCALAVLYKRFQHACGTGAEALAALRHTAALITQARDVDAAKLQQEIERNRVLEEALAALARTHHALEMSVAEELSNKKSKKKKLASQPVLNENLFDMFEDSDSDTLVTAGALSPWGGSPESPRRTPVGSLDGDITPTNECEEYHTVLSCSHSAISSSGSLHTAFSPDSVCSPHTPLSPPRFFHPFMKHPPRHRPSSAWSI